MGQFVRSAFVSVAEVFDYSVSWPRIMSAGTKVDAVAGDPIQQDFQEFLPGTLVLGGHAHPLLARDATGIQNVRHHGAGTEAGNPIVDHPQSDRGGHLPEEAVTPEALVHQHQIVQGQVDQQAARHRSFALAERTQLVAPGHPGQRKLPHHHAGLRMERASAAASANTAAGSSLPKARSPC
jgi:hypothetical protein